MIHLQPYQKLLSRLDLRATFAASLLGRLPIGMTGLAILLLVQETRQSFADGGAATGCYVVGLALIAPAIGRLIDRRGPHWALRVCCAVFPAVLGGLAYASTSRAPWLVTLALALLAGGSFPPITVCMRTYLRQSVGEAAQLSVAYSLESVLIELVFIIGPVLVALIVAFWSATSAVLLSATCAFFGTLLFLRSPALRAWRLEPRRESSLLGPLKEHRFVALIAVVLCYSIAFGMTEIGVTARAAEFGHPAAGGLLLGLMSVGSACGGLIYGSRSRGAPLARQFAAMLALMALGLALLTPAWPAWLFAALCVLPGIVMAPALIIQSMLVARLSAPQHMTEAFTWSASALLAGIGAGFALGGLMLEQLPSSAVFAAGAASALIAGGAAATGLRR